MSIKKKYLNIRESIPHNVKIVLAVKTRSADEVKEAIDAGCTDIGHNYVQEAEDMKTGLGSYSEKVTWHLIGHLQSNKVNKALPVFDIFQTVDSLKLAKAISSRSEEEIPILIEINSGNEVLKAGVKPDFNILKKLAEDISRLKNVKIKGLMTMGPLSCDPEQSRSYFQTTKKLFDQLNDEGIAGVEMEILSMGMSNSYKIAIEEGSNMIRIGTSVFGERD